MKTHTPEPWDWFTNANGVYLATPDRGHLTVMDFVRHGMNGAQPRFATWKGDERERWGGIMVPANKMTREEFAAHPDARLIAAAPKLLAALRSLDTIIDFSVPWVGGQADTFADPSLLNQRMQEASDLLAALSSGPAGGEGARKTSPGGETPH